MPERPFSTLKPSRRFMIEAVCVLVFTLVAVTLISLQLSDQSILPLGIAASVIIVGYVFARLEIGPTPFVETYKPPVTLPDGEWTELVLTLPNNDNPAETEFIEYDNLPSVLPDFITTPSVGGDEHRIDREALDAVFTESQATIDIYDEYGIGIVFPWNWSTTSRRESEIGTAREQLAALSTLLNRLPDQNVTYE